MRIALPLALAAVALALPSVASADPYAAREAAYVGFETGEAAADTGLGVAEGAAGFGLGVASAAAQAGTGLGTTAVGFGADVATAPLGGYGEGYSGGGYGAAGWPPAPPPTYAVPAGGYARHAGYGPGPVLQPGREYGYGYRPGYGTPYTADTLDGANYGRPINAPATGACHCGGRVYNPRLEAVLGAPTPVYTVGGYGDYGVGFYGR